MSTFSAVFGAIEDSRVRMHLYKTRNTWNSLFEPRALRSLDDKVQREFDSKWPYLSGSNLTPEEREVEMNFEVWRNNMIEKRIESKMIEKASRNRGTKRPRALDLADLAELTSDHDTADVMIQ